MCIYLFIRIYFLCIGGARHGRSHGSHGWHNPFFRSMAGGSCATIRLSGSSHQGFAASFFANTTESLLCQHPGRSSLRKDININKYIYMALYIWHYIYGTISFSIYAFIYSSDVYEYIYQPAQSSQTVRELSNYTTRLSLIRKYQSCGTLDSLDGTARRAQVVF